MPNMRFRPLFQRYVNCPADAQFYVCSSSNYSGCCKVDACHYDGGCPAGESVAGTTIGAATTTAQTASASSSSDDDTTTTVALKTTFTVVVTPTSSTQQSTESTKSLGVYLTTPTSSTQLSTASTATPTSDTSTTADRVSVTTATATATTTYSPAPTAASSSKSFPKGAIGGIVAAVVVVVLVVAAFLLFRRRRQQAMKKKDESNGSDERMLSDDNKPGAPTPTTSPMAEKGIFQSPTPMSTASTPAFNGNEGFSKGPAEVYGSPASSAVLFGELDGSDAALARYGPHGARLKGGAHPAIAELDSGTLSRAELESPQSTPASTPQVGSNSPNLSLMSGSNGGRSTLVSSWRSSTLGGGTIAEEQPSNASLIGSPIIGSDQEQQAAPLAHDAQGEAPPAQQQQQQQQSDGQEKPTGPVTESPRSNLDLSQSERGNGGHVVSWSAYQG